MAITDGILLVYWGQIIVILQLNPSAVQGMVTCGYPNLHERAVRAVKYGDRARGV